MKMVMLRLMNKLKFGGKDESRKVYSLPQPLSGWSGIKQMPKKNFGRVHRSKNLQKISRCRSQGFRMWDL
jgi:hypothetical protein